MSSNNLSQGGAKGVPANNSEDGARSKGTSNEKEDKESSGKDEKPKEEIIEKEAKDVDNKGPVLAPLYKPFPPIIEFSRDGINCVLDLKAEDVADLYARMMDHMHKAIKAFNKQIFDTLGQVLTANQMKPFKDQKECNFFGLLVYFLEQAKLRLNLTQGGAKGVPANNSEDGARSKGTSKECPKIKFSRGGKKYIITLKAKKVAYLCARMMDHRHKAIKAINKQIFDTLGGVMTANQKAQFKDQKKWDFSKLYDYLLEQAELRMKMTEGEKDWMKFETARKLKKRLPKIRDAYKEDWESKEMHIRQRAVALYFIDKLALRAGYQPVGKTDTVGCCTLRVEHIKLKPINLEDGDQEYVVEFNFLGKANVRYHKEVPVEKIVYDNIEEFKERKGNKEELFDLVTPETLNDYLQEEWMPGLTTRLFRTYNASITLQDQLKTLPVGNYDRKAFDRANLAVAILLNHRSSENLAPGESVAESLAEQMANLDINPNNDFNLNSSKESYLDPRIVVAWCRKRNVPVEEVYSPALMQKFKWAIDMAEDLLDYEF